MSAKRVLFVVLVVSAVMLAVGIGPRVTGSAQASPPAQEPDPKGVTIPYPGRLSDQAGQPVPDGAYDFTFTIYDIPTGGEPLWSETQEGVEVKEGAFVTPLGSVNPIPAEVLEGKDRWLEVGVRGPGEAEFTPLSPRQRMSPAAPGVPSSPSAGTTCPHDHFEESWVGSSFYYGLMIENTGDGDGVRAYANATASNYAALYGWNTGEGSGVYGYSSAGNGGYFTSGGDHFDIFLGGDVGRINAAENENSQLYLSSNADIILKLDNDGEENHVLRVKNSGGTDVCTIDEDGNLWCNSTKSAVVETADYGRRLLYAVESPEVWFEDFGSASLTDGEARVTIEPIFAQTVNLEEEYHVFVTPVCQEPVLLFVTEKDATGFTVRGVTLEGRPSGCSFDYRIVAKRLGYEDLRLEEADWEEGE